MNGLSRIPLRSIRQGAKAPFKTKEQGKELQNYYNHQKSLKKLLTSDIIESEKEREVNTMDKSYYTDEIENCAAALYREGWRSDDRDELKEEYNLDNGWTDAICKKLKEYERIDKND